MAQSTAATTEPNAGVSNQLASLVPTFNPASDDMTVYQQKVELVLAAWPKAKLTELVTRLILGCEGSAFQKLQLHQSELLTGEEKSVHRLIELLGGQWGRIPLQKQYDDAEKALFESVQKADETNDSFLARTDVLWSKLLSRKLTMEQLQAYIILRGSGLSPEEKKKVILDSDRENSGNLSMQRVTEAIRLLGASFFQEMTGVKKGPKGKVYDQNTLLACDEDDDETAEASYVTQDEWTEDNFIDSLREQGDDDACLIADFEETAVEMLQDDANLATAYSAYQEARARLSEKFRNRGFWPSSRGSNNATKGKGSSFNQKGSSKGKRVQPRRSLQDRIMSSNCRACGRRGHWKAECPYRTGSNRSVGSSAASTAPTTTVVTEGNAVAASQSLPMEFMQLPEVNESAIDEDTNAMTKGRMTDVFLL